jgi:hypothetical protein
LFLIVLDHVKDKARILEGGPWVFEGSLFMVKDFDGWIAPLNLNFDRVSFWIRMLELPLARMGRQVGLRLGSSMGIVEEIDTDKEGIGWGEFLRVKVSLDISKPLPRGRKLKYEGESYWIVFQYERLPKFCYQCGIIRHGNEGCQKRSNLRNQEDTTKFGPWLRAKSQPRKVERHHGIHPGKNESRRYEYYGREERHAREGRQGHGRKGGSDMTGGTDVSGNLFWESQNQNPKKGAGGVSGMNHGEEMLNCQKENKLEKERKSVRVIKELFQTKNEERSQTKEDQNLGGSAKSELAGSASKGKSQESSKRASVLGDGENNSTPSQLQMGLGESYSSPGGFFKGPNIANVEKTMKKAQEDGALLKLTTSERQGPAITSWKRKYRDETFGQNEALSIITGSMKKMGGGGEGKLEENATNFILKNGGSENQNGSGMAEAVEQPRRPQ